MKPVLSRLATALLLLACLALSGCSTVGYYWQSLNGHVQLMRAARPVPDWLADPDASDALKTRLRLSQRMRDFAISELKLPDNPSYRRYADLKRRSAVWNVVAAPPYSLKLKTWCFPVTGCVGYRGYFDEAAAQAEAAQVKDQEALEVAVYGVPAYSTLGWMNWAGGDPLLNTFIGYPEGELARLVFHELAHQVVFVSGDTMFNESFASTVEQLGAHAWLGTQSTDRAQADYTALDQRRRQFRALTAATRRELTAIYDQKEPEAQAGPALAALKAAAMQGFRDRYAQLRQDWVQAAPAGTDARLWSGYDTWVANANNASFGAQAAYDQWVPAFEALFAQVGRDWAKFYDAVRQLAKLPKAEREERLKALAPEPRPNT